MDNSSYRSQYIQSGNENISEQSIAVYDAFWKRLQKSEDAVGKPMEDGYTTCLLYTSPSPRDRG